MGFPFPPVRGGLCVWLLICVCRKVYISFGGLLLFLDGPWKKLTGLKMDHVYLLVKK